MFDRSATSLNIAFKWLSMFDLDQTFLSNILLHKQVFDHLATSANKESPSMKKQPIRNRICVTLLHSFSGNTQKSLCGLTLFGVDQTLFAHLATPCCVRQGQCWTKLFDHLAGA